MVNLIWRTIPKFPTYEMNDRLEVRHKEVKKIKSCYKEDGYLKLNINYQGGRFKPYLHQLVASVYLENPENKPEIHHIDCNSLNNHWSNLQWVTKAEHKQISKENGQIAHKLKPDDVIDIRARYSPDALKSLSEEYKVRPVTIYNIAIGAARSDIGGQIHEPLGLAKKIINIKTSEIYSSSEELSVRTGIKMKKIRRMLSGERYNDTPYRYLGKEHLSRPKPKIIKIIPFVSYSFGLKISKQDLVKPKNPFAQWKKVTQLDSNGNTIAEYRSIREAAKAMGANDHKSLQKLLNGKGNKTFKGFAWKFA